MDQSFDLEGEIVPLGVRDATVVDGIILDRQFRQRPEDVFRDHQIVIGEDCIAANACNQASLFLCVAEKDQLVLGANLGEPGEILAYLLDDGRPFPASRSASEGR
ncbi:hypothetical protein [Mesorhizobium sp.]|uniref:hypothetical protein n=1 Tax=Mesorhizobium sp. TaxID=1871066 RepID=UPI0025C20CC2|nr:hypothetical protein [Mesorhizobium sp.]